MGKCQSLTASIFLYRKEEEETVQKRSLSQFRYRSSTTTITEELFQSVSAYLILSSIAGTVHRRPHFDSHRRRLPSSPSSSIPPSLFIRRPEGTGWMGGWDMVRGSAGGTSVGLRNLGGVMMIDEKMNNLKQWRQ